MADYDTITAAISAIANETEEGKNTASIIGGVLQQILDYATNQLPEATSTTKGFMSASDKSDLTKMKAFLKKIGYTG